MKKNYLITVLVLFIVVLAFNKFTEPQEEVPSADLMRNGTYTINDEMRRRVTLDDFGGIQYEFRTEPNGYILVEQGLVEGDDADLQKIYVLMLEKDYAEFTDSTEPREGPPAITMYIFENSQIMFPLQWAQNHAIYSNINTAALDVAEVTVGGANTIRYTADGLYMTDNVVVAHGGYVYVISGAHLANNDVYQQGFENLVKSIKFVATP
ncbi:MAG: hypothetical protein COV34_01715 [Candidatus Zambryskibacteria bacterium CG10_big_fil_rev_8_21_14_0_10_42_12]|uniref:PsbP C-terminal domain-containing protein n=1 Tax=Candidatus Zambryskibacteria bacterium CG10_big_fil_rev_8_21_14_0_10_42_12 TaxID=1975115 RepID=A0A2H0QXF4_9BACT|nr:MAG: hypothetical protein COV34_01715 [Candidatus Zambryskibacteria bacterium CG10_big_fil_rev_8_21_14_0_10_42_12]